MDNNKLETISNLFECSEIRSIWDSEKEEYYFSVVDVVGALTSSEEPRKYWSVLKNRLKKEGSELTTKCSQLKMLAPDGKMRLRDALDTQEILRLIESIPSPKAEPFKLWLAQMGKERIDEVFDPELAKKHRPYGLEKNKETAKKGGHVAKVAKEDMEKELGQSVISKDNALNYKYIDDVKKIEDKKNKKKTIFLRK